MSNVTINFYQKLPDTGFIRFNSASINSEVCHISPAYFNHVRRVGNIVYVELVLVFANKIIMSNISTSLIPLFNLRNLLDTKDTNINELLFYNSGTNPSKLTLDTIYKFVPLNNVGYVQENAYLEVNYSSNYWFGIHKIERAEAIGQYSAIYINISYMVKSLFYSKYATNMGGTYFIDNNLFICM